MTSPLANMPTSEGKGSEGLLVSNSNVRRSSLIRRNSKRANNLDSIGWVDPDNDIIVDKSSNNLSPQEHQVAMLRGDAEAAGNGNQYLYTGSNAETFVKKVAGFENHEGSQSYQQETGDLALFDEHLDIIVDFIRNAETICLVGPGTCEKEIDLLTRCVERLRETGEEIALKRIEIYELSPEYNVHSYFRAKEFARDILQRNIEVKAIQGDFRETAEHISRGKNDKVVVLCLGGLTNPEKSPEGSFPSEHYVNFYEGLKRLAVPGGGIMTSFTTAGSDESLSISKREAQIRPIYDTPEFHSFIMGSIPPRHRDSFIVVQRFDPAGSLFHHYVEKVGGDYLQFKHGGEDLSFFAGDQRRVLTSTGVNTNKLGKLVQSRLNVRPENVLRSSVLGIHQAAMLLRAPR